MDGYQAQLFGNTQNAINAKTSRVQSDVERVLGFTRRVNDARATILRHTSALGYFSQVAETSESGAKVQPISPNLSTALSDLDRSLESLRDALILFE